MKYTVKTHCLEEPDLPYEDGAYTIYLYVDGDPGDLPEELVRLLKYMKCTTRSNAINRQLESLQSMVETVKQDKEVQKAAMHFQEYVDAERRNALKEGHEEGFKEGREEERKNTLLEKKRADEAEQRIAELERQLASLQKEHKESNS